MATMLYVLLDEELSRPSLAHQQKVIARDRWWDQRVVARVYGKNRSRQVAGRRIELL
jgi:hypothetical protein